jgi:hypothetical protein
MPAVQVLRVVLLQNYTRTSTRGGREVIRRREKDTEGGDGLPPGSMRLTSPYDTDARWAAKRDTFWNWYVRHEAPLIRAGVKGPCRRVVAATR